MTDVSQIKPHMPVICSTQEVCGMVDHVEGRTLKLTRDESGQHHFIPLGWIDHVDGDTVHLARTADEVMTNWSTLPPRGDAE